MLRTVTPLACASWSMVYSSASSASTVRKLAFMLWIIIRCKGFGLTQQEGRMSEQTSTPGEAPAEAESTGTNGASAEAASAPVATEAPVAAETPSAEGGGAGTADLVGLIEGKSDEEIVELIKALGEDSFFGGLFDEMSKRILPDKAAGNTAVIQYDINRPDGTKSYPIDFAGGPCNVHHDASQDA